MLSHNTYLAVFDQWIKTLDRATIENLSVRGSLDQGWIDVEFGIGNYDVYIILNNDPVQIYDRQIRRQNEDRYLQATNAVADFSPEQFKLDLDNLLRYLRAGTSDAYFESRHNK